MNTQNNTPASRNEEAVPDGGQTVTALKWCAATLQAVARKHAAEGDLISMVDTNEQKSVGEVLDMADAALAAPGAAIDAREQEVVAREDFDKLSADLTRAKNLLVRLHAKHPEVRAQIEGSTGPWFVWGMDRDAPASRQDALAASAQEPFGFICDFDWGEAHCKVNLHRHPDPEKGRVVPVYRAAPSEALSPATVAQPVDQADLDYENEHPAARRMRLDFEAKYGQSSAMMRAANHWFNLRTQWNEAWNRDREEPITESDVAQAERAMLAAQPCASQGCGGAELRQAAEDAIQWLNSWFRNHDGNKIADKLRAALSTAKSGGGATPEGGGE